MNRIEKIHTDDPKIFYSYVNLKLNGLICEEEDWLANLSNASALLYYLMEEINWAGFYLMKNQELVLGPFQGKPACTHIELGKGVCGTAAETSKPQIVKDVHLFEGHIACDEASQSEIVIPMMKNEKLVGVLDIDSPVKNRFNETDRKHLERFAEILMKYTDIPEFY